MDPNMFTLTQISSDNKSEMASKFCTCLKCEKVDYLSLTKNIGHHPGIYTLPKYFDIGLPKRAPKIPVH